MPSGREGLKLEKWSHQLGLLEQLLKARSEAEQVFTWPSTYAPHNCYIFPSSFILISTAGISNVQPAWQFVNISTHYSN